MRKIVYVAYLNPTKNVFWEICDKNIIEKICMKFQNSVEILMTFLENFEI